MLLQLYSLMLLIAHRAMCLCVYLSVLIDTDCAVARLYHTLLHRKKTEIAPALEDSNPIPGKIFLPETNKIIKQDTS